MATQVDMKRNSAVTLAAAQIGQPVITIVQLQLMLSANTIDDIVT